MKFRVRFIGGGVIAFVCAVLVLFKLLENSEKPISSSHHFEITADTNRHELSSNTFSHLEHTDTTEITSTAKTGPSSWDVWKRWVNPDYLYPITGFGSLEMALILEALSTLPVVSFGLGHKGTQLKASMDLLEHQRTVFKPMRYEYYCNDNHFQHCQCEAPQ